VRIERSAVSRRDADAVAIWVEVISEEYAVAVVVYAVCWHIDAMRADFGVAVMAIAV
jgi:hypothetical protein